MNSWEICQRHAVEDALDLMSLAENLFRFVNHREKVDITSLFKDL